MVMTLTSGGGAWAGAGEALWFLQLADRNKPARIVKKTKLLLNM
jgi:hypothetical protein